MAKIRRKQIDLTLNNAPDNFYGFSSNIPNVQAGDELELAIDKIVSVLDKLAPAFPPLMNTLSLTASPAATTGYFTTDGTQKTNIYKFVNGTTITWTTTGVANSVTTRNGHFRDGDSTTAKLRVTHSYNNATKTATISNIDQILVNGTATAADSTNYNVQVDVTEKKDYYSDDAAAATKSNFYKSIKAAIAATLATTYNAADDLERTLTLSYSADGTFGDSITLTATYRVEAAASPSAASTTLSIPTMNGRVSGVPTLEVGDTITIASTISNGIKYYYPGTIGTSTVTATSNSSQTISGAKTPNSNHSYSVNHTVLASQYSESIAGSVTPYDIFGAGSASNASTSTTKRVDTYSTAKALADATKRLLSPATGGQYDAASASAYDVTAHQNSLNPGSASVYSYQLQLLTSGTTSRYCYPTVDYTAYGGPNYSSLTYSGYRYADFNLGSVSNITNLTLNIVGASGISQKYGTSNFKLLIKVGSGNWLDANAAWSSGTPTANGDAAVDVGNSASNTARRITFGATVSGTVYVRVGINSGSSITFTDITKS